MYSKWTSHLETEEEKEKFKVKIHAASEVLERLSKMVEDDLNSLDRSETDQRVYDLANWQYRQAHKNGIRQYATTVKNIINLDQREN